MRGGGIASAAVEKEVERWKGGEGEVERWRGPRRQGPRRIGSSPPAGATRQLCGHASSRPRYEIAESQPTSPTATTTAHFRVPGWDVGTGV